MLRFKLFLFLLTVRWVGKVYLGVETYDGLLQSWLRAVEDRATHRGTVEAIGWIKAIRLSCTRYLCGDPLSESPGFGVQLNLIGLPIGVPMVGLIESRDPTLVRFVLTLLGVARILPGWKSPDLEPITSTAKVNYSPCLREDLVALMKELNWKIVLPRWEGFHVTTKAGPNAMALVSSIEDASLLTEGQLKQLLILGGEGLIRAIDRVRLISPLAWLLQFKLKPRGLQGKLSVIKDKEAKSRIVAILDYWSQSALAPLHASEMRFLKGLKSDCTFNQGSFKAKLPLTGPYYSYDLTSATDRFPASLQEIVLSALVGSSEYAAAWRDLICNRDYKTTWGDQRTVRYGVGQPMGAYSSWATFAITHHAIVQLAAKRAGMRTPWWGYALLGDDIVLTNEKVATHYRAIMCEVGVDISPTKSHVSKDTYEFAKRWVHAGVEVTPAPMGSLFEAIRTKDVKNFDPRKHFATFIKFVSFYGVVTWIRELESRWLPKTDTLVTRGLLASLFNLLGVGGQSSRLADKAWRFFLLPSREDGRHLRRRKSEILGSLLLSDILTCNSMWYAPTLLSVYLTECKARVLEEAIKRQMGKLRDLQLEMQKFLHLAPEGLDAQSLLLSLPPFGVVLENIKRLQLEFDKARAVRESDSIMQWLHLDVRLFIDPMRVLSVRTSKVIATNKVSIMNHCSAMCKGIAHMRALALRPISDASLVHTINTYEVTPHRMRGKSKRG